METIKHYWSQTNRWHRALFVLLIIELRCIPCNQMGFVCNDPALSYQFTGDTISWKWLLAVTALLPFVFIIIVENKFQRDDNAEKSKEVAIKLYKQYLYGLLLNLTLVSLLKVLVGEPRPHFFDTCGPKEAETCVGSEYVSSYTCSKAGWVSQSDRSFPSGHTSLAVQAGLFLIWYLHKRVKPETSKHKRIIASLQCACALAAIFCSYSRILDRRHHACDVAVGAGIGLVGLIYTVCILCNNFNIPYTPKKETVLNCDDVINNDKIINKT